MENMIVLADQAGGTIIPFENDSIIVFNENQLNNFLLLIVQQVEKGANNE